MNAAQQSTIAILQGRLTELQKARNNYKHVLLGAGHLVRVGPVYLKFTITSERLVTDSVNCTVESADLFVQEDAEAIAKTITNGHNEKGQAVHVTDAIEEEIAMVEKLLTTIS